MCIYSNIASFTLGSFAIFFLCFRYLKSLSRSCKHQRKGVFESRNSSVSLGFLCCCLNGPGAPLQARRDVPPIMNAQSPSACSGQPAGKVWRAHLFCSGWNEPPPGPVALSLQHPILLQLLSHSVAGELPGEGISAAHAEMGIPEGPMAQPLSILAEQMSTEMASTRGWGRTPLDMAGAQGPVCPGEVCSISGALRGSQPHLGAGPCGWGRIL